MSNRVLLWIGFALLSGSVVLAGVFTYFVEGKPRVLVVTMEQDSTQAARERLKQQCGGLPGVEVVADRGPAERQGRLPVRFEITSTATRDEAALEACVGRNPDVRGFLVEGDR